MFELLDSLDSLGSDSSSSLDFLDQTIESNENLIPTVQLDPDQIDPRYLRTSYSSSLLFHACPRKLQLKSLGAEAAPDSLSKITFAFGHLIGTGIQELLIGLDWNQVLWNAFKAWPIDLDASNEKQQKSFWEGIAALMSFKSLIQDGFLSDYEVAYFEGKPAAELSFQINLLHQTYRGFVDLVLRHKFTGELLVLEIKTTSANYVNVASYKNSAQAIGYSVVLEKIEPENSSYGVLYLAYLTKQKRFETFEFPKTYHQRSLWVRDRLWDEQTLVRLVRQEGNYGIWPMQGESCYSFGRTCEYMDICHLDTESIMTPVREHHFKDVSRETGEEIQYQFTIEVGELL